MPIPEANPPITQKKKIFCIRLDETYMEGFLSVMEYAKSRAEIQALNNYGDRVKAMELNRLYNLINQLQDRLFHAYKNTNVPIRTGIVGLDRVVLAEINRNKGSKNGATITTAVSEPRPARRRSSVIRLSNPRRG